MPKQFLVGYTGFVGSNIAAAHHFDGLFNSKNITEAFDENPDLLIYAGIPARKFYANQHPAEDLATIETAKTNIKNIHPKKLILISTIDVIAHPDNFYENDKTDASVLQPYGHNRLLLEEWAKANFKDSLIVRLPALYGINLKKNFIFDLLHPVPGVVECATFNSLLKNDSSLQDYYEDNHDGYFKLKNPDFGQDQNLLSILKRQGFTALNFTDSRAKYQFYNLKNLWSHLEIAQNHNLDLLHLATEPISAAELYKYIYQTDFQNHLDSTPASYNYKTLHADLFGGHDDYIFDKETVLKDIKSFVESGGKKS